MSLSRTAPVLRRRRRMAMIPLPFDRSAEEEENVLNFGNICRENGSP